MKTSPVTHQDLRRSVIAALARRADLSLNEAANRALLAHLEAGGVQRHVRRQRQLLQRGAGRTSWILGRRRGRTTAR